MAPRHYAFPADIPKADIATIPRRRFDIAYATASHAQRLDVYWPAEGDGRRPVIVALHGGAFMGGDKRDLQLTPMLAGLARGYAVVSVNYRMSGEAVFPALVHDVKAAIRWVRAHAAENGFDPERIATWGGSAGGWLSLMAGVSTGIAALEDPVSKPTAVSDRAQAVVAWFPPTNFLTMDQQLGASGFLPAPEFAHSGANSPESLLLGRPITEVPELVRAADPTTYVRPGLPPFLLQHGTHDDVVPYQQSLTFTQALAVVAPGTVRHELLNGARHADVAFETRENVDRVLDFLDGALGR